jgi:hypothetical protein
MKITKKTFLNILLIAFIVSFFVTPVGYYGKVLLNKIFSFSPDVTEVSDRERITDYNWRLKDANWNFFNFKKSKGNVVLINLWASWKLPCVAELASIQEPVEAFMKEHNFTFPVTYLIIGEKMPISDEVVPASYLLDKLGNIVIHKEGIADWDNSKVRAILDGLIKE